MSKKIFIIGDSISIQYGPALERSLPSHIQYARKEGVGEAMVNLDIPTGANGGDSSMVFEFLSHYMPTDEFNADLLLVNAGLHDIKTQPETGNRQIDTDAYRSNLTKIIELCASMDQRMIWIRTTPVDDELAGNRPGFTRCEADVDLYNSIADEVMQAHGIHMLDMYGFTMSLGLRGRDLFRDHAHYPEHICELQGAWMAGAISQLV